MDIVHAALDAFSSGRFDRIRGHFHPEVETRVREGTVHGLDHTERFMRAQTEQFAEFRIVLNDAFEPNDDTLVA